MTLAKLLRELEHIADTEGDDVPVQVCIESTYGAIRDITILPRPNSRSHYLDDADIVVMLTASLSRDWR
jgi:hypothetical protein